MNIEPTLINKPGLNLPSLMAGFLSLMISSSIFANPVLNNVSSGNVSIQQTNGATVINQTSQKAIINWQSFNINANESTHFQQPAGGTALNRINPSQGISNIYGRLTATGQIILVNPAGIFFGPGSYVNVGGLIASTANITDKDFLNGYYHFSNSPDYNGSIINQGTIIAADHGLVALIGGAVSNEGMIVANLGSIALGSGSAFTMTFAGNDLIGFTIDTGVTQAATDQNGNSLKNGVSNTGSLYANGGQILVSAKDAAGVLDHVINMQGYAEANAVTDKKGSIVLWGDDAGSVLDGAKLTASSGTIIVKGSDVTIDNGASFDVSSANGDGGFIETSGTHSLILKDIAINTAAPQGKVGTWLIDPADINITTFDANITGSSPFTATATGSTLNVATLTAALVSGNVTVLTTNDGFAGSGNITVSSAITWSSSNALTLQAFNSIIINAPISGVNGSLNLSAVNAASSITTGASGTIDVNNFNLLQGQWNQVGTLPAFTVRNSFQINSGVMPNATAQFIRATSGNGTVGTPYVLTDVYGLQGVGSNTTTLAASYLLSNNIDASVTLTWNNGAGFIPIGNGTTGYTGTSFNGNSFVIKNLYINSPRDYIGLFGMINSAATTIANVGLSNISYNTTGTRNYIGGLVGYQSQGNIANSFATGTISSTGLSTYLGGLVGGMNNNSYSITNSNANTNISIGSGSSYIGGLVGWIGYNLVSKSYSAGSITVNGNGTDIGGFAGLSGTGSSLINIFRAYSLTSISISGTGTNVGGFVGRITTPGAVVTNAYATGAITVGSATRVGGFVGYIDTAGATLSNSLWDIGTTGLSNGYGTSTGGNVTSLYGGCFGNTTCGTASNATNTTPVDLSLLASYTTAGWSSSAGVGGSITSTASTTATAPNYTWFMFGGLTRPLLMMENTTSVTNMHQLQMMGVALNGVYTLANNISFASVNSADVWNTNLSAISVGNPYAWPTSTGFVPVGNATNNFTGSFDGQNYTITSLFINTSGNTNVALFGRTGSAALLQNIVMFNPIIYGGANVGGIVGYNGGTLQNSSSTSNSGGMGWIGGGLQVNNVDIRGGSTVGGLAGVNAGTITNSNSRTNLFGGNTGHLAGTNNGVISNSYSTGATFEGGAGTAGGLIGTNSATGSLINSYFAGSVTAGYYSPYFGGLVAFNSGLISKSYNLGFLYPGFANSNIGGLVGYNNTTGVIQNSYNGGSIAFGQGSNGAIGGVAGTNAGTITNTYTYGVMYYQYDPASTTANGFVGNNSGTINNSFWDIGTSGYAVGYGSNSGTINGLYGGCFGNTSCNLSAVTNATNAAGTPVNLALNATYTTGGPNWDMATIWNIADGYSYPYLRVFYAAARAIAGITPSGSRFNGASVAYNGAVKDSVSTGYNGFAYFLEGNNVVSGIDNSLADGIGVLVFTTSGGASNFITSAPTGGASIAATLTSNTVTVGTSETNPLLITPITNTQVAAARNGIVNGNILYSNSGNNITVSSGYSFTTLANTPFDVTGNVGTTNGNLTFNGAVTINTANPTLSTTTAGTLAINNTVGGGGNALTISNVSTGSITGIISNLTAFTKAGAGTLTLSGVNTYSGTTTVNGGTLSIGADTTLGTAPGVATASYLTLNGGSLLNTSAFSLNSNRGITIGASGGTLNTSFDLSYDGIIAGTGALTKLGTAKLILTGANTHSGTKTISAGTLQIGNGGATGSITGALVNNAAVIFNTSNSFTLANTISGTGTFEQAGSGTLTISGTNTYTGQTTISNGVLSINSIGNAGTNTAIGNSSGAINIGAATLLYTGTGHSSARLINATASAATIDASGSGALTLSGGISGNAVNVVLTGSGTATESGAIATTTGTVIKNNTGTWTLSGASTYSGDTTLNAGILSIGASSTGSITNGPVGTGALMLNGGTLQSSGSFSIANPYTVAGTVTLGGVGNLTLSGAGTLSSGSVSVANSAGTITLGGNLTGALALNKSGAGTLTISGADNSGFSGATTLSAGTLSIASATNGLGSGQLNLNNGTLTAGASVVVTNNYLVNGTPSIVGGNFTLSGNGNLSSGTLTITPNNPSIINLTGTLTGSAAINTNGVGLGPGLGIGGLTIDNSGYSGTITSTSALTIYSPTNGLGTGNLIINGGTIAPSGTNVVLNNVYSVSNALTIGTGNFFNLNMTGAGTLNAGSTISSSNGFGQYTLSGNLTGSGAIQVIGVAANVALSGANNSGFSGNITLGGGVITAGAATNALGTGTIIFGAGVLTSSVNTVLNNNYIFSGASATGTINGSNNITMNGTGTFADNTQSLSIANTAGTVTLANAISGAGSVAKSGAGTLAITAAQSYTGNTTLSGGTIQISTATNAFGSGGTLALNGSTLQTTLSATVANTFTMGASTTINGSNNLTLSNSGALNSGTLTISNSATTTLSGVLSGASGITFNSSAGTFILNNSNTYTGKTTVTAGTLNINSIANLSTASALGAPTTVANGTIDLGALGFLQYTSNGSSSNRAINLTASGGTIDASGSGALTLSGGVTGNTFNLNLTGSGTATQSGVIATTSGTLTKNGTGTWTLSGANSYTGSTTINAGTVSINTIGNTGTNTSLGNSSGTINLGAATLQYTGSGDASLRPIALTASGGTIDASGSGTLTLSGGISGANNNLILTGSGNGIESGAITNTLATLTKTGAGKWTLSNAGNTFGTGNSTIITGGILSVSADGNLGVVPAAFDATNIQIGNGGILQTNNAGTLTFNSNRGITLLAGGGTIQIASGTLAYSGLIDGANALTLTGPGNMNLGATIGSVIPLASLTENASIATFNLSSPSINTSGAQIYNSAITLSGNSSLTSTADNITFGSTINGINPGGNTLTANASTGSITFNGTVSNSGNPLGGLSITANDININTSLMQTWDGNQTYNGTLHILQNVAFNTNLNVGTPINFNGNIVSPTQQTISMSTGTNGNAGIVNFNGAVGLPGQELGGLTTAINGVRESFANQVNIIGPLSLNAPAGLGFGTITFGSGSSLNVTGAINLTAAGTGGFITFNGPGGASGPNITAGSTISLSAPTLNFNNYTALNFTTSTLSMSGNVNANSTLPFSVTGNYSLNGTLGTASPITTTNVSGTTSITGTVQTQSNQTYSSTMGLNGTLDTTGNGNISITGASTYSGSSIIQTAGTGNINQTGALTLNGSPTITTAGGNITFGSTINGVNPGGNALTANAGAGSITFNGMVSNTGNPLGGLSITANDININTTLMQTWDGNQTYNGTLHILQNVAFNTNVNLGSPINFNGDIVSPTQQTITMSTGTNGNAGILNFNGAVGLPGQELGGLTTAINGVRESFANQVNIIGPLSINAPAGLGFGTISFGASASLNVTGAVNLSAAGTGGFVTLNNLIGTVLAPVGSLSVSAPAININSAQIISTGTQSYSGPIALGAGGNIVLTSNSGAVTASSTITGNGNSLIISNATSSTLSGIISNLALAKSGSGTLILANDNTYAGGTTINSGTLQIGNGGATGTLGTGTVTDNGVLDINRSGTFTIPGVISGSGSFIQDGTGITILTNNNTYSGNTVINAGTLQIGNGGATGAITGAVVDNGALVFNTSNSFTLSNIISGTGSLTQQGSGTITIAGTNSYTGQTSITGGILSINTIGNAGTNTAIGNSSAAINIGAGTLQYTGSGSSSGRNINLTASTAIIDSSATGPLNLSGGINGNGFNLILTGSAALANSSVESGVISGTGSTLTKNGAGTWMLTNANTYTGGSTINVGFLNIGNGGATGSVLNGIALNGGTIVYNLSTNVALNNNLTGSGTMTQAGPGILTASGNINFTGTINVQGGTLQLGAANVIPNTMHINMQNAVATLDLNNFSDAIGSISGGGASGGNVTLGSGTLTTGSDNTSQSYAGIISGTGGLTTAGTGTFTLSGSNNYTGATTINTGTLQMGAANALSASTAVTLANTAGATFDLNGFDTAVGSIAGGGATGGNITMGAGTLTAGGNNSTTSYGGVISGSGGFTKTGTGALTLSGTNIYTGTTTLSAGVGILIAANVQALGNGAALVLNGGTLNLATDSSINPYNTTISGIATINSNRATSGAGITHTLGTLNIGANTLNLVAGANVTSGTAGLTFGDTTLSSGAVFNPAAGTSLTLGALQTAGSFAVQNTGIINLNSAANAARTSGIVSVAGATMNIGNVSALGTTGVSLILNSSTLNLNTDTSVNAYNITIGGNTTITSDLASAGAGITQTLGTLSIGANTLNIIKGSNVTSGTGGVTFGTVTLGGDATLTTGSSSSLTLGAMDGTTSGGQSLTFTGTGSVNLNGSVGANTALNALSVTASGGININNNNINNFVINTTGTQNYSSAVTLSNASTNNPINFNGSTITISSTMNSGGSPTPVPVDLAINGALSLATTGSIGLTNPLNSLNVTGTSSIGGNILTVLNQSYANAVSLTANSILTSTSGYISINSSVNGVNHALTINNTDAISSITGVISNLSNLTKSGIGTLTLTANNSYNDTTITAGTLQVGNGGAAGTLGTGAVTDNGVLAFNLSSNATVSTGITGTGSLSQLGAGTTILTGNNTYNGGTTISAGTLQVGNGGTTGSITGNVTDNSALVFDTSNNFTEGNVITGSGSLTQAGSGMITLSGVNNYSGGTTLAAGAISVGNNSALGSGALLMNTGTLTESVSGITLANNIALGGSSIIDNAAGIFTLGGTIQGTQVLTLAGAGTTVLSGNVGNTTPLASVTANTNLTVSGGGIATTGNQTYNNAVTLGNAAVFDINSPTVTTQGIVFNTSISGGQNLTLSGSGNGTYNFTLNALTANNVTITTAASSTNNSLTLNSGSPQNFTLTALNTGKVTGITAVAGTFNFNHIQNLIGGIANTNTLTGFNGTNSWNINAVNGGNVTDLDGIFVNMQNLIGGLGVDVFNFTPGMNITGSISGGDTTNINVINYASYGNSLTLNLNAPIGNVFSAGSVDDGNTTITTFSEILQANGNSIGRIILPNAPNIKVTYYDASHLNGEIADPFFFFGWIIGNPPPAPPAPSPSPSPFNTPYIAPIINQPVTNYYNNNNYGPILNTYGQPIVINDTYTDPLLNSTKVNYGGTCYLPGG